MSRGDPTGVPATPPFSRTGRVTHRIVHGLFFASFTLVLLKTLVSIRGLEGVVWPEISLAATATVSTLVSWFRILPAQNVLLAAAIVGAITATTHALCTATTPLAGGNGGPRGDGGVLFEFVSWAMPFAGIVAVLTSRRVAQIILRRRRRGPAYGLRLLGLTLALCAIFGLGLDSFSARLIHPSAGQTAIASLHWPGVPAVQWVGWLVVAILALGTATPALIDKRPGEVPPENQPLIIWVCCMILFAAGSVSAFF